MSTITGGLRHRLVVNSFRHAIDGTLEELGWLDPGRSHLPIHTIVDANSAEQPEPLNTIIAFTRGLACSDLEVGSGLCRDSFAVDVVFYAQSDSLAVEVLNDLRDAMRGRLTANFSRAGGFPLLDFQMATPAQFGCAYVVDATVNRRIPMSSPDYLRHIHTLECVVHDDYYADNEEPPMPGDAIVDADGISLIDEHGNILIYK